LKTNSTTLLFTLNRTMKADVRAKDKTG
jgi:hypothetical protein